jgi:hypothetical protein
MDALEIRYGGRALMATDWHPGDETESDGHPFWGPEVGAMDDSLEDHNAVWRLVFSVTSIQFCKLKFLFSFLVQSNDYLAFGSIPSNKQIILLRNFWGIFTSFKFLI